MKNLKFIAIVFILFVVAALFLITKNKNRTSPQTTQLTEEKGSPQTVGNDVSLGMYAEENAIIPSDQKPGNSVIINKALLENPGYLVIHEENNGEPGDIIGSSTLYQKGEFSQVVVELNRQTNNGETLYAMIHQESDSNQSFDLETDKPVQSKLGGQIMASFIIDADAGEAVDINI